MTVCDLINELMLVREKDKQVVVVTHDSHIEDVKRITDNGNCILVFSEREGD